MGEKIKKSELKSLIGDAVNEATKPLKEQLEDVEKRQPKIIKGHPEDAKQEAVVPEKKVSDVKYTVKRPRHDAVPEDEFSFVRFVNAQRFGTFEGAPFEKWARDQTVQKDTPLTTSTSSTYGGYLVGAEFLPQEFINYYEAAQITRQAGMRILPCTGTPVNIPKLTSGVTTYWVAENAEVTKTDAVPGQLQLTPHLATARTQISKTLFQTSRGAAETLLRQDIGMSLGRAIDLAVMEGSGAAGEPTGMAETASINTVSASSGAITFAMLHDMELDLQTSNVRFAKPAWLMHPRTWHAISEIVTGLSGGTSDFIFKGQPELGVQKSVLGYPVYLSTAIAITNGTSAAEANVFLADMDDIILAEWGGIDLAATDTGGDAWAEVAVEIRAVATLDVGVRNAGSVCLISDTTS